MNFNILLSSTDGLEELKISEHLSCSRHCIKYFLIDFCKISPRITSKVWRGWNLFQGRTGNSFIECKISSTFSYECILIFIFIPQYMYDYVKVKIMIKISQHWAKATRKMWTYFSFTFSSAENLSFAGIYVKFLTVIDMLKGLQYYIYFTNEITISNKWKTDFDWLQNPNYLFFYEVYISRSYLRQCLYFFFVRRPRARNFKYIIIMFQGKNCFSLYFSLCLLKFFFFIV